MQSIRLFAFLAFALPLAAIAADLSEVKPLLIGESIPDVAIRDQKGQSVSLHSILNGKKSVIVFYRGGWCPYCNRHLQELASIEKDLIALGYQIIAISPDSPENLVATEQKQDLAYALFSDSELKAAEAFGIAYDVPKARNHIAKASGGLNTSRLPVSSVFLATSDARVAFQYVDPNYRYRIPSKLLLAAAEATADYPAKP